MYSMLPANELQTIQSRCKSVFTRHNVIKAGIFGSFAKGAQTAKSDVDFVLAFQEAPTLFQLGEIKHELESVLQRPCDVLTYTSLEADAGALSLQIQNEVQLIYAKDHKE